MKADYSYNQYKKQYVRHNALYYAVEILTSKRESASCVSRNYVRKLYDYFTITEDDNRNKSEALKISKEHILNWEQLHDSCTGIKRPQDLSICYLCGSEPNNDFDELVSLGILPQNIWAFESDNNTYNKAIRTYTQNQIPQPHILKQNIETFFCQTPKKFDIIYIDACGSIASSQHALKCITYACIYHRMNSPGIIISNFSEPTNKDEYKILIDQYMSTKNNEKLNGNFDEWTKQQNTNDYKSHDFNYYYGEYISSLVRDIPSIIVPLQRFAKNPYLNQLIDTTEVAKLSINDRFFTSINNNAIAKYFCACSILQDRGKLDKKTISLLKEIGDFHALLEGFKILISLKNESEFLKKEVVDIKETFESKSIYQFLDKHHSNLLVDVIINQLSYPMHYNPSVGKRFQYKAKSKVMFTDVTVYDECRYIYDWLPALHQIKAAYKNESWQYIFRFALDGLVKTRQAYNDEFFYQDSVVENTTPNFEKKYVLEREKV